jgi:GMP synthase (glutamine-hydrolysing)
VGRGLVRAGRSLDLAAMKPLLCVRHQATVPLGVIEEVLELEDVEWQYLDAWQDPCRLDVSDISGLIVLGGGMNVDQIDQHPWLRSVRDLTASALDSRKPVLGICLGAQVLARAAGARVGPSPVREVGFLPVRATAEGGGDRVLGPFAPEMCVFQFHEDACDLPHGADLLFTSDDVPVQAFRVGDRAYGVQFHFEVTEREIGVWCDETPDLEAVWGVTREEVLDGARVFLASQKRAGRAAALGFLELVR